MIADLFIRKDVTVRILIDFFDKMDAAFGGNRPAKLLCYGSVLTVTIESPFYISNDEIYDAADNLDYIITDIVRRG